MIDSHAHIFSENFIDDLDETLERAREAGIEAILMPNIDSDSFSSMNKIREENDKMCYSMAGLHPCSVKEDYKEQLRIVKEELNSGNHIAVGEIGTDLYWDDTYWEQQKEAFLTQCQWAAEMDLPVAIHCRDSIQETINLLQEAKISGLTGVFHCFTGTLEQANQIIDMGFYLGVGGVLTFKNGGMEKVYEQISLKNLLLETDSPYLSPSPHRGKRNEPSMLSHIALKLSYVKQMPVEEVKAVTTENTLNLFKISL